MTTSAQTARDATAIEYGRRLQGLRHMIGNTPLLEIHFAWRGRPRVLYAKAEHVNMTGSIKDRMARLLAREAALA